MDDEIQLISDGDGLAVIGDPVAVERFLASERLASKELAPPNRRSAVSAGAAVAQTGSEVAGASGRWVKLTKKSAADIQKYGLMKNSKTGLEMGVVQARGQAHGIKGIVQFTKGPGSAGSRLANPAVLAGAAGVMAQLAMQQAMDEITDYLAAIDEKVDDVLRAQKDAALARMIGVGLVIEEAMTLREAKGRVDDITWSKVQGAPATIAETQVYALRQLDALAEKLENKSKVSDLVDAAKHAESSGKEWLLVLARCLQLQNMLGVLELDRVLDADPTELEGHRLGLKIAHHDRLELIAQSTERLVARMDAAAGTANAKVLLNPISSREVVQASNQFGVAVVEFQTRLGIEHGRQELEARRWADAATEARDKALSTGAEGVDAARRLGSQAVDRAKSGTGKVSSGIADLARRRRRDDGSNDDKG